MSTTSLLTTNAVTEAEDARLWGEANSALQAFIAAGLRGGEDGVVALGRGERREESSRLVVEFGQAVEKLRKVTPPGEQAPLHEALLPIYVEMRDQAARIVEVASSGDSLGASLEWRKLAMLVDEAGAVSLMLSRDGHWVVVANTDARGVFLRRTPRMDDTLTAWPDGTRLLVVGGGAESQGRRWVHVVDPGGQVGWVPEEYVTMEGTN